MNQPILQSSYGVTLVGGGPVTGRDLRTALKMAPVVVGADGGANRLMQAGIAPQAVIGDLDSISSQTRAALPPGGLFLTRVGDASAGLPYHLCNWVDHAVTFVRGHRLPRLYCRPLAEWVALLQRFGFVVETDPMNEGKPFANVMLVCRVPS